MAYTNEMTFGDWVFAGGQRGNALIQAIEQGELLYQKWYQLSYGKSNAQIAALPQFSGKSEADIGALAYAMGALHDLYVALGAAQRGYLTPVL